MLKVKLTTSFPDQPIIRQTPGGSGIWNGCRFFINKPMDECDYWVVYEGLKRKEAVRCPQGNTLLITAEPPPIKTYHPEFLAQFDQIITCHRAIDHHKVTFSQQAQPWHIGLRMKIGTPLHKPLAVTRDYDTFKNAAPPKKEKLISVICSAKTWTDGHRKRRDFALALKSAFGEKLDLYGRGFLAVEDKWDAIAPYKYHVAIENCSIPDYWTEKLADTFLGGSYPFYYGCPNIRDYFPADALTQLDIADIGQALKTIDTVIAGGQFEKGLAAIEEARTQVLDKYNLFAVLADYISKQICPEGARVKKVLYPEQRFGTK